MNGKRINIGALQNIFIGLGGDKMIIGALFEMIKDVTPEKIREKIRENKNILDYLEERDWHDIRKLASETSILDKLTPEYLIQTFAEKRPDLLYAAWQEPNANIWFEQLLENVKEKLAFVEVVPPKPFRKIPRPMLTVAEEVSEEES